MIKDDFLALLLKKQVLSFGSFVTKSKRVSPYFFNTGLINSGRSISEMATAYANKIHECYGKKVTTLYGPAYKGIPLCVSIAEKLSEIYDRDVFYAFDRKEAKDHGEGGFLVGYHPSAQDFVVVVEDVLTAGTSLRDTIDKLSALKVKPKGVVVGIDRQERLNIDQPTSARTEFESKYGVKVEPIITLDEIIERLDGKMFVGKRWIDETQKKLIDDYRATYCARS